MPIQAVGVWDTVGALGIPPFLGFQLSETEILQYSFVNTKVSQAVVHAFHALGLDEHRAAFKPAVWQTPEVPNNLLTLKQCWFPGVHSDIGGGYHNADLANLTLAWMISQLEDLIDFDHGHVTRQNRLSTERHEKMGTPIRDWGTGKIHDSMTLFFRLGGSKTRTPGEYFETDRKHATGKLDATNRKLENTGEVMHSSVRIRMGRQGLGYNDKGTYDSEALQGWTMKATEQNSPPTPIHTQSPGAVLKGRISDVRWVKKLPGDKETPEPSLPEDEMGALERTILESWPGLYEDFDTIMPGSHATSTRRSSTFPADQPHNNGIPTQIGTPRVNKARYKSPHREETI